MEIVRLPRDTMEAASAAAYYHTTSTVNDTWQLEYAQPAPNRRGAWAKKQAGARALFPTDEQLDDRDRRRHGSRSVMLHDSSMDVH